MSNARLLLVLLLFAAPVLADTYPVCPVSHGEELFVDPPFGFRYWYGTDALAARIPPTGIWPTTAEGALIAVKLFWYTADAAPSDAADLVVSIRHLFDDSIKAEWSETSNAGEIDGDQWTFLVGIDFQHEGCWEVTGTYLGQKLSFVVRTVDTKNFHLGSDD
jgi:hypothetical protein